MRRVCSLIIASMLFASFAIAQTAERPFAGVEVHLASGFDQPVTAMSSVVAEFEELTGIKVTIEQLSWEALRNKWILESIAGTGYFDIIRMSPAWLAESIEGGWLLPLDDFIAKSGYDFEDYSTAAITAIGTHPAHPEVWSLPLEPVVKVLGYRIDLFEDPNEQERFLAEYGYELAPPTNHMEFLDVAAFFTRDTNGDGRLDHYGFVAPQGARQAIHWLYYPIWSFGGDVVDPVTRTALLYSPETVAGLEWALRMDAFQPPAALGWGEADHLLPFGTEGNIAMGLFHAMFDIAALLDPERSVYHDRIGFVPLPVVEGNPAGYTMGVNTIAGGGLAISSASKNQEAAWEFLAWVTSDPWALRTLAREGALISKRSVYTDPEILADPRYSEYLPVYGEVVEHGSRSPALIPELTEIVRRVILAYHDIRMAPRSIDQILQNANSDIQRILDQGN